jgi:tRNA-dihydrouridine synthase A
MVGDFEHLEISINGGIGNIEEADDLLVRGFASVMIGRAAYQRPYDILSKLDGHDLIRDDIARQMADYAAIHMQKGGRLHQVTRHMMGLYHGQSNGKIWRQLLSENASKRDATPQIILDAMPKT